MLKISHIELQSETSLSIYFDENSDTNVSLDISLLADYLRHSIMRLGATNVIPCAASLFIEFHILKATSVQLIKDIRHQLANFEVSERAVRKQEVLDLPIYYHPEVAPDLEWLAEQKNLTIDEVIKIHARSDYTVASLGFAPGFAYLSGLDSRLATPRLSSPRNVAKGSLGIADEKTAVYPDESPGGWVIIGNCPVSLFDFEADPISPFKAGMTVRFKSITREEFLAEGGEL